MTTYDKLFISMRYWLLGISSINKDYVLPLKALEFASQFHTGLRKDNKTKEFEHQLAIGQYIRTLTPSLIDPPSTLAVAFLHDVSEDYDVSFHELENLFGKVVSSNTKLLTKVYRKTKENMDTYFHNIGESPIASIGKGCDRIHNIQSMVGVFTKQKQMDYISEAETYIIPMLKKARRLFPEQEAAYENIKLMMNSNINLIKVINSDELIVN